VSEAAIERIHEKIDRIAEQGTRTETMVSQIEKTLSEYKPPCIGLVELQDERKEKHQALREKRKENTKFWDGVKSKLIIMGIVSTVGIVFTGLLFAVKHGWTP